MSTTDTDCTHEAHKAPTEPTNEPKVTNYPIPPGAALGEYQAIAERLYRQGQAILEQRAHLEAQAQLVTGTGNQLVRALLAGLGIPVPPGAVLRPGRDGASVDVVEPTPPRRGSSEGTDGTPL
jgi:hypothetical protein